MLHSPSQKCKNSLPKLMSNVLGNNILVQGIRIVECYVLKGHSLIVFILHKGTVYLAVLIVVLI